MNDARYWSAALRLLARFSGAFAFLSLIQTVVVANLRPSEIDAWFWQAAALGLAGHGFNWVGDYVERRGAA